MNEIVRKMLIFKYKIFLWILSLHILLENNTKYSHFVNKEIYM